MIDGRVVFLLEERSMKALLDALLPRLIPGWVEHEHFQCLAFEGKSDLQANVPRKLRHWKEPGVRFVVVRDNDGAVCVELKERLSKLCDSAGRPDTLIRLVCQHLESWYLGDLTAVAAAFGVNADTDPLKRKYAEPDRMTNAEQELARLAPAYQKIGGARALAPHLSVERNTSHSFHTFVSGVRRIAAFSPKHT